MDTLTFRLSKFCMFLVIDNSVATIAGLVSSASSSWEGRLVVLDFSTMVSPPRDLLAERAMVREVGFLFTGVGILAYLSTATKVKGGVNITP